MEALFSSLLNRPETLLILLLFLMLVIFTWWHHARTINQPIVLRPLPGFDLVRSSMGMSAETGQAIHISPGAGTVGSQTTAAETIVGLLAAERIATEAALKGAPIMASSGDAVAHLALRGTLRQAYHHAGQAQNYRSSSVELVTHQDPMAYATGVSMIHARQKLAASQMIGSFGIEFLLIGEDGNQREVPQVTGATSPGALPAMVLSTQSTLIGEEIFAAEAYLSSATPPKARLLTQDMLRTVIIVLLVIGVIYGNVRPILQPLVQPWNIELPPLPIPGS